MKKILTIALTLALLLLVFAGCQSANNNLQQPATNAPAGQIKPTEQAVVPATTPTQADVALPLTKQAAIEIALTHAGVTNDAVQHLHAWRDTDDGVVHYDVDFRHGDYYYAYEISEQTGEIFKLETENDRTNVPQTQLTEEEATQIALAHAGFTSDSVKALRVEFDREDHRYEVEFRKDGVEYTYEVCAEFGKILDIDKDWDD